MGRGSIIKRLEAEVLFLLFVLVLSLGAISNFACKCTGGWHLLLGIIACCTSSGVHGSVAGSSARNYPSLTFRSFNSGTPPGDGAVTRTSACHTLQLIAVTQCGCRFSFPNFCLASSARAKSCLSHPPLPDLLWPVTASLQSLLRPLKGVWLVAPCSLGSQP